MSEKPRAEYTSRLEARRALAKRAEQRSGWLAHARLAAFLVGAGVVWLVLITPWLSAWWSVLPVVGFGALVAAHDRARRAEQHAQRAVRFYERALARLEYEFAGTGLAGERFRDPEHAYADHLDLFGEGSLFELIANAQTDAGLETLASWLKAPAAPDEIRARQDAVEELRTRLDLREDLAVLGPDARDGLDPEALERWGRARTEAVPRTTRLAAAVLALATVLSAGAIPWLGWGPFFLMAGVELGFSLLFRARARHIAHDVEGALRNLSLLRELLARVEREFFEAPALLEIRQALETKGVPPSREIALLARLTDLLRQRRNQFFAPIAPFLLWTTQLSFAIEAWRAVCGPRLAGWLAALGKLEALCDLAGYAYEHPDDPFPEIVDEGPLFAGEGVGHPLIPESRAVRNDVRMEPDAALLVISGSNMSGKSTLLRTVGTNAALALAGAPVRARHLRVSPLAVGASIVVRDSLREGASHFYAEITRLRRIADLAGSEPPLLFLLDEILAGTNSHDRGVGASAVVRGLIERGAIGLLTTHDLALARIADDLAPRATNVHFEDHLEDGEMIFDYQLRQGVVTHSNAIALMRAVGLDVGPPDPISS
jgi:hypothetical protein